MCVWGWVCVCARWVRCPCACLPSPCFDLWPGHLTFPGLSAPWSSSCEKDCVCAWAHLWSGYILEELSAALCVKKPDKHICLFPCGVIVALFALTPSLRCEISVTAPLCSQIPCPLCRRTAELHSSLDWTRNRSRKTQPSHPVALEPQQIYFCMQYFETATNEVKRCAGDAYDVAFYSFPLSWEEIKHFGSIHRMCRGLIYHWFWLFSNLDFRRKKRAQRCLSQETVPETFKGQLQQAWKLVDAA